MRSIICVLFFLTMGAAATGQVAAVRQAGGVNDPAVVKMISPPVSGFYDKLIDAGGIPVRSAAVVEDRALVIAAEKINRMLAHMPEARSQLVKNGSEFHIIGRDQQTSDLPEFRKRKGVKYMDNGVLTDIDARTRGMGGLSASCGEENLLHLPGDRYGNGSDICMHEFAHTIMNFGLDYPLRQKIKAVYSASIAKGNWMGAYAASNPDEYWGELSMWYFGAHGEFLRGMHSPAPGQESLKNYDAAGYALLDSIYSGLLHPPMIKLIDAQKVAATSRSGFKTGRSDLTIVNNSDVPVNIYWINFEGSAVPSGSINAGKRKTMDTVLSHVWKVETTTGQVLGYWQADTKDALILLH